MKITLNSTCSELCDSESSIPDSDDEDDDDDDDDEATDDAQIVDDINDKGDDEANYDDDDDDEYADDNLIENNGKAPIDRGLIAEEVSIVKKLDEACKFFFFAIYI